MTATLPPDSVIWHDVECGAYAADLPLWLELAARGPESGVLDLGAGTGRVALELARHGVSVTAVDVDPGLTSELGRRAGRLGLDVEVHTADVRTLDLGRRFGLVLAPMQLAHLMPGADGRLTLLRAIAAHLAPGGLAALALLDQTDSFDEGTPEPLPDVREVEGWVFSSTPVAVRAVPQGLELVRRRQRVAPDGELLDTSAAIVLESCPLDQFEAEARSVGLLPAGRRDIPETPDHVGSVVVLLEGAR